MEISWKIGSMDPEIICLERFILKKETTGCTSFTFVNFGVNGQKYTKFTNNVARSSRINLLNQNGDNAIRIEMSGLRIKVNSPILSILTIKLVAIATYLEPSEKGGGVKSVIYDQMPTMWWKFGKNRSSRFCVFFAQMFILKRKRLTQNKIKLTC